MQLLKMLLQEAEKIQDRNAITNHFYNLKMPKD